MNYYRYIPKYTRSSTAAAPEFQSGVYRRANVKARPGGQQGVKGFGFKPSVKKILVVVFVLALLFLGLTMVRLSLFSTSVSLSLDINNIENQINSGLSEVSSLDIQRSTFENLIKLKKEAIDLGMHRQPNQTNINLKPDVVTLDSNGNLVIAQSIMKAGQNNS